MSDLKLFRLSKGVATEMVGGSVALEKKLQTIIEANMETLFGVRFLASEFSTGVRHGGRIDSLGIDENGSPVIFEYKRSMNENVINQGLFYLDWLIDHQGDFAMLVQHKFGPKAAEELEWTAPRLVCVASDFTRYDAHAILQMGRPIELVRYRDFEGEFLALDLVASTVGATNLTGAGTGGGKGKPVSKSATVTELLDKAPEKLASLYADLDSFLMSLGDDVTMTPRKLYFAYRRIKNFACVEVHPHSEELLVFLKIDPATITLEKGFSRDVSNIGHFGTGDLELHLRSGADLDKAQPLLQMSYDNS